MNIVGEIKFESCLKNNAYKQSYINKKKKKKEKSVFKFGPHLIFGLTLPIINYMFKPPRFVEDTTSHHVHYV